MTHSTDIDICVEPLNSYNISTFIVHHLNGFWERNLQRCTLNCGNSWRSDPFKLRMLFSRCTSILNIELQLQFCVYNNVKRVVATFLSSSLGLLEIDGQAFGVWWLLSTRLPSAPVIFQCCVTENSSPTLRILMIHKYVFPSNPHWILVTVGGHVRGECNRATCTGWRNRRAYQFGNWIGQCDCQQ